ncbi:hypothetical protein ANN_13218 [Periplaneta americana]|uniref:RNase H type-1 domain-containing protein n=1 Tax=Periplaneta americana TaxID=6978 RepID=A0ABQ8TLC4_PERAM|nr:hypothetical protein ANN_13218 [Periplaneta americana]
MPEVIRSVYSDVDSFIGNDKNIFLNASFRIQKFKEIAPGLPLPPNPIITKWGSWLDAAFYYATYYVQIVEVINSLDSTEAHVIEIAKSLISVDLSGGLDFIQKNFCHLPKAITLLETSDLQIPKAINIVEEVSVKFKETKPGEFTKKVNEKLQNVLAKNNGFSIMCGVRDMLLQKQTEPSRSNSERNISDIDIDIPDITASWCDVIANSWDKAESHAETSLKVIKISPATSKVSGVTLARRSHFGASHRLGLRTPGAYQATRMGQDLTLSGADCPPVSIGFTNVTKATLILFDSRAAIQTVSPNHPTETTATTEMKLAVKYLMRRNKEVVFHWILSHVGIEGNESADLLAKKGIQFQLDQRPIPPEPLKKVVHRRILKDYKIDLVNKLKRGENIQDS